MEMELTKDISGEKLPQSPEGSVILDVASENKTLEQSFEGLSHEDIQEKVEIILLDRIKNGDKLAMFQLGQLYFEQEQYADALKYFERIKDKDFQAMYQLGVIYYDGLAGKHDHKLGVEYMIQIAESKSKRAAHLVRAAQFNVGRAYFQGYGVRRQSSEEAERWWLLAADDGNPRASLKAQTALGMFYSQEEALDLHKAFFWHSEACGNGSLESQGALGVMYLNGLGVKKDINAAFICLREAAERGNVYAMGNLVSIYYQRKLYTKALELAARAALLADVEAIAAETDCLPGYIAKGIAIASFFYARCLHHGHGIKVDKEEAQKYYSKSYQFDPDVCARMQDITNHGQI